MEPCCQTGSVWDARVACLYTKDTFNRIGPARVITDACMNILLQPKRSEAVAFDLDPIYGAVF